MDESKLRELIRQYINDNCGEDHDEDDIEEITTTGDVDGYSTPFAFSNKKGKKRKKKISTNSTGYNVVKEELNKKDLDTIKKLIRDVIADVYRDIWIKRTTWK